MVFTKRLRNGVRYRMEEGEIEAISSRRSVTFIDSVSLHTASVKIPFTGDPLARSIAGGNVMKRFLNASLAGLILTSGLALTTPTVSFAQDHRYHDKKHNDDHEWNDHENQAYRIWLKDHHRKEVDFGRLKARDQQNYWNWRHSHSDAQLKINIR